MNYFKTQLASAGSAINQETRSLRAIAKAFHEDDRGDNENLGRMLILALILVPIVILLAIFGNEIYAAGKTQWEAVMKTNVSGGTAPTPP